MDKLFRIFKVDVAEAGKIADSVNDPHHHDFEELLIGIEGELEHFIDFRSEKIIAPFACFVTKGKVHQVKPGIKDGKCDIWVLRFRSEFIPETTFQLYSYYHDQANIPMVNGLCFNRLVSLCEMIDGEMQAETPDYAVIRHLVGALFIMIESERKKLQPDDTVRKTQNITFKNFLEILEENFRRPEGVEYYAEKLFMSSRNLNIICQNILQLSVSEIIETRKLIEAKNLLITTEKTIAEIGFELGFNEKSYFTNVFKKRSGLTPTEFREEMKRLVS